MSRFIRFMAHKMAAERAVQDELKRIETFSALTNWIESLTHDDNQKGYSMSFIQGFAPTLTMNEIAKILVERGFTKSRKETPQGFLRLWHPPKLSG